jgi:hypothetical protein
LARNYYSGTGYSLIRSDSFSSTYIPTPTISYASYAFNSSLTLSVNPGTWHGSDSLTVKYEYGDSTPDNAITRTSGQTFTTTFSGAYNATTTLYVQNSVNGNLGTLVSIPVFEAPYLTEVSSDAAEGDISFRIYNRSASKILDNSYIFSSSGLNKQTSTNISPSSNYSGATTAFSNIPAGVYYFYVRAESTDGGFSMVGANSSTPPSPFVFTSEYQIKQPYIMIESVYNRNVQ